jgi:hypothetical protein
MSSKNIICAVALFLALGSLTFSGCGKNVMGPTSPQVAPSAASQATTPGSTVGTATKPGETDAACVREREQQNRGKHYDKYVWSWKGDVAKYTRNFWEHIVASWYADFQIPNPFQHLTSNALFLMLVHKFDLDDAIMAKTLEVLSLSWAPGWNTNPGNFTPEVSLLPMDWNQCKGFQQPLYTGWKTHFNSVKGYEFHATNPDGDLCNITAGSAPYNVFNNEKGVIELFEYEYEYYNHLNQTAMANFQLRHYGLPELDFTGSITSLDGNIISILITLADTDKSGVYNIQTPEIWLQLRFAADGSGGGFVKKGQNHQYTDDYEYTVDKHGCGYYTLNGGEKHCIYVW